MLSILFTDYIDVYIELAFYSMGVLIVVYPLITWILSLLSKNIRIKSWWNIFGVPLTALLAVLIQCIMADRLYDLGYLCNAPNLADKSGYNAYSLQRLFHDVLQNTAYVWMPGKRHLSFIWGTWISSSIIVSIAISYLYRKPAILVQDSK